MDKEFSENPRLLYDVRFAEEQEDFGIIYGKTSEIRERLDRWREAAGWNARSFANIHQAEVAEIAEPIAPMVGTREWIREEITSTLQRALSGEIINQDNLPNLIHRTREVLENYLPPSDVPRVEVRQNDRDPTMLDVFIRPEVPVHSVDISLVTNPTDPAAIVRLDSFS